MHPFNETHRTTWRGRILLGLTLALVSAAGCGSDRLPTYRVKGKVVFEDGTPVKTGQVESRSAVHSLNARGKIGRDGTFQLGTYSETDGVVAGPHRAIVVQFLASPGMPEIDHDHGDPVALRYADYQTADLEFVVSPDQSNEVTLVVRRAAPDNAVD